MEAVTIAGLAAVVFVGFYSAVDFLDDLGIHVKKPRPETKSLLFSSRSVQTSQRQVKKMSGMHV